MINNINEVEIIIPVLNEEKNIILICEQIIKLDWKNIKIFIHFIDDGSIDNSWKLIKELSGKYNQVNGTRLSRNFGKDCAILAGIQKCSSSHALIMDGDLQHPVKTIIKLINKMNDTKCDIVSANKINYEGKYFRSDIGQDLINY